jgi:hypothetical protein
MEAKIANLLDTVAQGGFIRALEIIRRTKALQIGSGGDSIVPEFQPTALKRLNKKVGL